jgi:hypothetical protein
MTNSAQKAADFDLSGLLTDAPEQPPEDWTRPNEARGSIASQLCVKVATFAMRQRAARADAIDARRFERATDALVRLPEPLEYVHIVTGQEFSGFDLLPAMLALSKADRFDALTLTTLGFSKRNLEALAAMVEAGKVQVAALRILCSDFFRRSDREIWQIGREQADRTGYGFRSTRNHTKIILAAIAGKSYVVESSANLRSCANLEQFCLCQSKPLYDFHAGWIEQVWPTAQD